MDLPEQGDEALVVDLLVLGGEGFSGAEFFEHVVDAGEREAGMLFFSGDGDHFTFLRSWIAPGCRDFRVVCLMSQNKYAFLAKCNTSIACPLHGVFLLRDRLDCDAWNNSALD